MSAPAMTRRRLRSRGGSRIGVVALVLVGVVTVAAVVSVIAGVFLRSGPSTGGGTTTTAPVAPVHGIAAAQDTASRACTAMVTFVGQLRSNAAADATRSTLGQAEALARAAADADPHWIALLGAVQAVRVSIDQNSSGDALVGIGVVRDQCDTLRVTVP